MIRFYFPIVTLAAVMSVVACSGRDPVAEEANNVGAPAEVDVLPPDESVTTTTDELENGATDDVNGENSANSAEAAGNRIPASFRGRWALSPADCQRRSAGGEGAIIVTGNELRFYESVARPLPDVKTSDDSMSGNFAFSGEGTRWTKHVVLQVRDNKLVRTENDPMASFTYARCAT